MSKNLRQIFRSELIRQRKDGAKMSRDDFKRLNGGKSADYKHIRSDSSYAKHWSRAQIFAHWLRNNTSIRKMDEISPQTAIEYLIYQREQGYSASTIGSDALVINHLMIGSGYWKEDQRIIKHNIPAMPKRSVVYQRYKQLDSKEWRDRNPKLYQNYQRQIDTVRAFGLRRRELVGGTSLRGRDGFGPQNVFRGRNGLLVAQVIGKGGKIRLAEVRKDMASEMEHLYGHFAKPISYAAKSPRQFKQMIRHNQPFYHTFTHHVPTHIFRADYAQNKLQELDEQRYNGTYRIKWYRRAGRDTTGKQLFEPTYKTVRKVDQYQIGAYKASYGAFLELSRNMGHNRLDVLNAYLGTGR